MSKTLDNFPYLFYDIDMKNWNDVIIEKTQKDCLKKNISSNLLIVILIFLFVFLMIVIKGDLTYVFAFTERKIFDYSINQKIEKINNDSILLEKLSDDFSISSINEEVLQSNTKDTNNENENSEGKFFNLSYFKNSQQNNESAYKNGFEVKILEENENAEYQLNDSLNEWTVALNNADKIFHFNDLDLGIEGQAISFYEKSVFYYYAADYYNAIKFYSIALENDHKNEVPKDERFSVLYLDKAVETMKHDGTLDASELLDTAILLDPNSYQAYYLRGLNQLLLGHEFEAVEDFNKCISISPDFADVYISLGYIAYENGDYSKANNLFDKGIQLNKESGIGFLLKGMVFEQMNVPSGAKLYYEKAKVLLNEEGNLIFLNEFINNFER